MGSSVYCIDDVQETIKEHLEHIPAVLKALQAAGLKAREDTNVSGAWPILCICVTLRVRGKVLCLNIGSNSCNDEL